MVPTLHGVMTVTKRALVRFGRRWLLGWLTAVAACTTSPSLPTTETAVVVEDQRPPSFSGISAVQVLGPTAVRLYWAPATDETTPSERIVYRLYAVSASAAGQGGARSQLFTTPYGEVHGVTTAVLTGLRPGTSYLFGVRAGDLLGRFDVNERLVAATTPTPAPVAVPVASADPLPRVVDLRLAGMEPAVLRFELAAADGARCRLDEGDWTSCSSPWKLGALEPGSHTVVVVPFRGDLRGPAAVVSWEVAAPAVPEPRITWTRLRAVTDGVEVAFGVTAATGTRCRVDGGAWEACGSPWSVTGLAAGWHTLALQPYREGVTGAEVVLSWEAPEREQPAPRVGSAWLRVTDAGAEVHFELVSATGARCRVDGGAWVGCVSPWRTGAVVPGWHTVAIAPYRETRAGEVATLTWEQPEPAVPAPRITLLASPPPVTNATEVRIAFAIANTDTAWCQVTTVTPCHSPWVLTGLTEGSYTAAVSVPGRLLLVSWRIDRTPPELAFVDGPGDGSSQLWPAFVLTGSTEIVALRCRLDDEPWSPCAWHWSPGRIDAGGVHRLEARARDAAGNWSDVISWSWSQRECARPGTLCTRAGFDYAMLTDTTAEPARLAAHHILAATEAPDGTVYFSTRWLPRIWRLDANGGLEVVAGNGAPGYGFVPNGGVAVAGGLGLVPGLVVRGDQLYYLDASSHCVRRLDLGTGRVHDYAGVCGTRGYRDGPRAQALFSYPYGFAYDPVARVFYVSELGNTTVRRISDVGVVTVAGKAGAPGDQGDGGPPSGARFRSPNGLAVGAAGELYVVDAGARKVRVLDFLADRVATVAGDGSPTVRYGAPATRSGLPSVASIAAATDGTLYLATSDGLAVVEPGRGGRLRRYLSDPRGPLVVAGTRTYGRLAWLALPSVVALGRQGLLFATRHRLYRVGRERLRPLVGSPVHLGRVAGRLAAEVRPRYLTAAAWLGERLVLAETDRLYVEDEAGRFVTIGTAGAIVALAVDPVGQRIFVADANGRVYIFAVYADTTSSLLATLSGFVRPGGVAYDATRDELYVADAGDHCIYLVTAPGGVGERRRVFAGSCGSAGDVDGLVTVARFSSPGALALADDGSVLWLLDRGNYKVRRILLAQGSVETVAGDGTAAAQAMPGQPATRALPFLYAIDGDGRFSTGAQVWTVRAGRLVLLAGRMLQVPGMQATVAASVARMTGFWSIVDLLDQPGARGFELLDGPAGAVYHVAE